MVKYFSTFEEAALFAAYRRNEGYFAEVCDDCVSQLWGPLAVGGCRVISSDTLGEDRAEPRGPGKLEEFLLGLLRSLTLAVSAIGLIVLVFWIGAAIRTVDSAVLLTAALVIAAIVIAMTALSTFLAGLVVASRHSADKPPTTWAHVFTYILATLGALLSVLILLRELLFG